MEPDRSSSLWARVAPPLGNQRVPGFCPNMSVDLLHRDDLPADRSLPIALSSRSLQTTHARNLPKKPAHLNGNWSLVQVRTGPRVNHFGPHDQWFRHPTRLNLKAIGEEIVSGLQRRASLPGGGVRSRTTEAWTADTVRSSRFSLLIHSHRAGGLDAWSRDVDDE